MTLNSPKNWLLRSFLARCCRTESVLALCAIAHNLLKGYGPQCWIWFSTMDHWVDFGSALWAMVWNQLRIWYELDLMCIHWLCIHNFSACSWQRIHVCTAVSPHAHSHVYMWSYIHMHLAVHSNSQFGYVLWAKMENLLMGHSAEFSPSLWATHYYSMSKCIRKFSHR